jgi:hypothetical protein
MFQQRPHLITMIQYHQSFSIPISVLKEAGFLSEEDYQRIYDKLFSKASYQVLADAVLKVEDRYPVLNRWNASAFLDDPRLRMLSFALRRAPHTRSST